MEQRFPDPTGVYAYAIIEIAIVLLTSAQIIPHDLSYELSFFAMEVCLGWYALLCYKLHKPYCMGALLTVIALAAWVHMA